MTIIKLFFILLAFDIADCAAAALERQFALLYSGYNNSIPETEAWNGRVVLDTSNKPYNRMAFCGAEKNGDASLRILANF